MKIAILEICATTHYTLINALIKTYSTDPNNSIEVYTIKAIAKSIRAGGVPERTSLIVFDETKGVAQFLKNIENTAFDRLHICTIENHYAEFAKFKPHVKDIFFHMHDIDIWFEAGFKNKFKNLVFATSSLHHSIFQLYDF